jgi:hypothetical protein
VCVARPERARANFVWRAVSRWSCSHDFIPFACPHTRSSRPCWSRLEFALQQHNTTASWVGARRTQRRSRWLFPVCAGQTDPLPVISGPTLKLPDGAPWRLLGAWVESSGSAHEMPVRSLGSTRWLSIGEPWSLVARLGKASASLHDSHHVVLAVNN